MNTEHIKQLCDSYRQRLKAENLSVEQFLTEQDTDRDTRLVEALQGVYDAYFGATRDSAETTDLTSTVSSDAGSAQLGSAVGPYKLLQSIGAGGMGQVYLAEQQHPVKRRVALKIIKPGMDSGQVIARFEAERQALAMMDHPNIARVLDAGATPQGRPFFVMELVKGEPITDFSDKHRLTPRERLELFLPVCEAIQHAHQKGIIHRDLKPSNILVTQVDGRPIPKVIDFGLAKAVSQSLTDKSMFTQFGQILGTLDYMSPEQASFNHLDIDTRTDIYSLGVVLYELLTGETPFDRKRLHQAALDEILRIIQNEDPPRPSLRLSSSASLTAVAVKRRTEPHKLSRLVRDELDWIVMKALEKDRSRRYETANGLQADIKRYLSDEPIVACPPSNWTRLRKFARRNKIAIGFVTAVSLALIVGTIGTTIQAIRANTQALRANTERDRANGALLDLNTSFGLLADELGRYSEAMLWFAEAAAIAEPGSIEDRESRIRLQTWSRFTSTPIHFFDHDDVGLRSMHFDSSGKYLATLTLDDKLRIRDLTKGGELAASLHGITSMNWHPTLAQLAIGSSSGKAQILEQPSFSARWELDTGGPVTAIAFNSDGQSLATGGTEVHFWNEGDAIPKRTFPHPGSVQLIQFSTPEKKMLTLCDGLARVYDLTTDASLPAFPPLNHRGDGFEGRALVEPRFVQGGKGLLTKWGLGGINWTDLETGNNIKQIPMDGPKPSGIAVSPDGQKFLFSSQASRFELWDCQRKERIGLQRTPAIWACDFSPDGLEFVVTHGDGSHQRINTQDGSLIGEVSSTLPGNYHIKYGPSGRHLATCDGEGRVYIWLLNSQAPLHPKHSSARIERYSQQTESELSWSDRDKSVQDVMEPRMQRIRLHGIGSDLALSKSGQSLLVCGANWINGSLTDAQLFATADLTSQGPSLPSNALLLDACLSPDETTIVTASLRHELIFWDAKEGKRLGNPVRLASEPMVVRFSEDGKRLFCLLLNGEILMFDAESRRVLMRMQHGSGELPDLRRQSNTHAYLGANGFPMLDPEIGFESLMFENYSLISTANGDWVITAGIDETICVWNTSDGNLRYPPIPFSNRPMSISISVDRRLLVAADGKDVAVFELSTGEKIARYKHSNDIVCVSLSSDARRLVSSTYLGDVFVWDLTNQRMITTFATRELEGTLVVSFFGHADEWILTAGAGARCWSSTDGRPLTPWLALSGQAGRVIVSSENRRAFISGKANFQSNPEYGFQPFEGAGAYVDVLPLEDFYDEPLPSTADWQLIAEVLSGKRVGSGASIQLNATEWASKFMVCQESNTQIFHGDWKAEQIIGWHESRRLQAIRTRNWNGALWHVRRLDALLEESNSVARLADLETHVLKAIDMASEDREQRRIEEILLLWNSRILEDIGVHANRPVLRQVMAASLGVENADAVKILHRVYQVQRSLYGPSDKDTLRTLNRLARLNYYMEYRGLNNGQSSQRQFQEFFDRLDALVKSSPMDHEARAQLILHLTGCPDKNQRNLRRACDLMLEAIELTPPSSHPWESNLSWLANDLCWTGLPALRVSLDMESEIDFKLAIDIARQLVDFAPDSPGCHQTLGVAQYYDGQWASAVDTLNQAIERANNSLPDTLGTCGFVLAMAHYQLGDLEKAKEWYQRSVELMANEAMGQTPYGVGEYRKQAEELMQIDNEASSAN